MLWLTLLMFFVLIAAVVFAMIALIRRLRKKSYAAPWRISRICFGVCTASLVIAASGGEWNMMVLFAAMRRVLQKSGNITEDVKVWFDHRALTLWPTDPAEQEAIARRENVMLARDGESVTI